MMLLDDAKRQVLTQAYASDAALNDPREFLSSLHEFSSNYTSPEDQEFLSGLTLLLLDQLSDRGPDNYTIAIALAIEHYRANGGHAKAAGKFLQETVVSLLGKNDPESRQAAFDLAMRVRGDKSEEENSLKTGEKLVSNVINHTAAGRTVKDIQQAVDFYREWENTYHRYDSEIVENIYQRCLEINDPDALKIAYDVIIEKRHDGSYIYNSFNDKKLANLQKFIQKLNTTNDPENLDRALCASLAIKKTNSGLDADEIYRIVMLNLENVVDRFMDMTSEKAVEKADTAITEFTRHYLTVKNSALLKSKLETLLPQLSAKVLKSNAWLADQQLKYGHYKEAILSSKRQYDLLPLEGELIAEGTNKLAVQMNTPARDKVRPIVKRLQRVVKKLRDNNAEKQQVSAAVNVFYYHTYKMPKSDERPIDVQWFKPEFLQMQDNLCQAVLTSYQDDPMVDNFPGARFLDIAKQQMELNSAFEKTFYYPAMVNVKSRFKNMAKDMVQSVKSIGEEKMPEMDYSVSVLNNLERFVNMIHQKTGDIANMENPEKEAPQKLAVITAMQRAAKMHYEYTQISTPQRAVSVGLMKKSGQSSLIAEQQSEERFDNFLANLQNMGFVARPPAPSPTNFDPQ